MWLVGTDGMFTDLILLFLIVAYMKVTSCSWLSIWPSYAGKFNAVLRGILAVLQKSVFLCGKTLCRGTSSLEITVFWSDCKKCFCLYSTCTVMRECNTSLFFLTAHMSESNVWMQHKCWILWVLHLKITKIMLLSNNWLFTSDFDNYYAHVGNECL
jgi:hypothetical protein